MKTPIDIMTTINKLERLLNSSISDIEKSIREIIRKYRESAKRLTLILHKIYEINGRDELGKYEVLYVIVEEDLRVKSRKRTYEYIETRKHGEHEYSIIFRENLESVANLSLKFSSDYRIVSAYGTLSYEAAKMLTSIMTLFNEVTLSELERFVEDAILAYEGRLRSLLNNFNIGTIKERIGRIEALRRVLDAKV